MTLRFVFFFVVAAPLQAHQNLMEAMPYIQPEPGHRNSYRNERMAAREEQELRNRESLSNPQEILNPEELYKRSLVFWNLSSGQKIPAAQLKASGISAAQIRRIQKRSRFSSRDRKVLTEPYSRKTLRAKLKARERFLEFVEIVMEEIPSYRDLLPELLTVWGEARQLAGFTEGDLFLQKATMATVIHVIRNRSLRRMRRKKTTPHLLKWQIATRRYQFSAFEPYDPNLSVIALGPKPNSLIRASSDLPRLDAQSLQNLTEVIHGLNSGNIVIALPLGNQDTRHYITPRLQPYDRREKIRLSAQNRRQNSRFRVIQIPKINPRFLTIAPRWSEQEKLITYPKISMKDLEEPKFTQHTVPPQRFIYFEDVL